MDSASARQRSSVVTETLNSRATVSIGALSGGNNLDTALSLNNCPYLATSFFLYRPSIQDSIEATTILTQGGALKLFDERVMPIFSAEDLQRGGLIGENRRGEVVLHPLPALSIGALMAESCYYESHHEISTAAADAKKQAKKQRGSSLFIERRRTAYQNLPSHDAPGPDLIFAS